MTDSPKKLIRVRFAPSPTGPLHIGGARTALFNWLFARQNSGKFILRIENTDVERSTSEYEKDILDGLRWLGLDWDEGPIVPKSGTQNQKSKIKNQKYVGEYGPYKQSERLDIYEKYLKQLLDEHKAYYCFCSKEQLESDRQAMLAQGMAPKYSGRCRTLNEAEREKRIKDGESAVIRFKMPEVEVEFNDIVRGKVKFDASLLGDIVIAKNLKSPLYNFAAMVDDYEMKITHVIRGEEHLSNTPKQILIQKVLGFDEPKYAHLPLFLNPDRSKMSKRYMDASLGEFRTQGYLSEAIVNFIALLGWHPIAEPGSLRNEPSKEQEIFTRDELIKLFDLKRVQRAGAVFNIEKLDWLNSQYIKKTESADLIKELRGFIPKEWAKNKSLLRKAIDAEKERMGKLIDFKTLADFFFDLPEYDKTLLAWPRGQILDKEKILNNLKLLKEEISKIFGVDFTKDKLEKIIMPFADVWGRGELLWPLRVALSGKEASPGPFEIMEALGKEEALRRIDLAIKKLQ